MNRIYQTNRILKIVFVTVAMLIVLLSSFFSNKLARKLAVEEKKKIEIWADATRQLILADETTNIDFLLNIIEGNTTIPVIMADDADQVLDHRNFKVRSKNEEFYFANKLAKLKGKREPISIELDEEHTQYIYYDTSLLLKQLQLFPLVQFAVTITFFLIVILVFSSTKRAEQNQVWVGLSKETAHQLGTPISSLHAWTELLKLKYGDDKLISDMENDVNRLSIISERFSKIGSKPDMKESNLNDSLTNAVNYIRKRSSDKVEIKLAITEDASQTVPLNIPLFEWVIENLCKNAIDAMNGSGKLHLSAQTTTDHCFIDITDSGKGIDKKHFKAIFTPGFTTKERGWGLGLSLVKRIIEEYHGGKIFVKESELNKGSTFRIILPLSNKV